MTENQEVKDNNVEETAAEGQEHQASTNAGADNDAAGDNTKEKANQESPLDKLERDLQEAKDQHLRLYAEFENYRKRTSKERLELFGTANQELMSAMLPILDDFQRAIKAEDDKSANEGLKLIYQKFESTLKNKGLKPMDETTGKDFDADTMEAITQIPAPDKKMKGKVIDEIERGYMLGNKILRFAKVVVGQ